jgi:serine protease
MGKLLLFIYILAGTVFSFEKYFNDRILFCLKNTQPALSISYKDGKVASNIEVLDEILNKHNAVKVERWLTCATDNDVDGDVKLANIYRVIFGAQKSKIDLQAILQDFKKLNIVYAAHTEERFKLALNTTPKVPNDKRYDEQWYLGKIKATHAWGLWNSARQIPGDSTILIGIVDTGLDYDHPDLAPSVLWNLGEDSNNDGKITAADENGIDDDGNGKIDDFKGWDFAGADSLHIEDNDVKPSNPGDDNILSHGTYCAGLIAAVSDNHSGIAGVSLNAKLIITKHATDNNLTDPAIYNAVDGMLYCARMGADVINCAFGGYGYNSFTQNAINNIVNKYGSIIVCAGGNDDSDNDTNHFYPADYQNTISVAALNKEDKKADYSNYGSTVDICAPGGEGETSGSAILSTVHVEAGSYASWQGTSASSSLVTGAFALLKAFFPSQSRTWIINELLENSDPTYDRQLGKGKLNIYNAVARNLYPKLAIKRYAILSEDLNGDTELNPGEAGQIQLTIENDPVWLDASEVSAFISSKSPYIAFQDDNVEYGSIAAGDSMANATDPFYFKLSDDATLEPVKIYVTIAANKSGRYNYKSVDSIQVQPTLNQIGFPVLKGTAINLPVSCDSLFGNTEKQIITLAADDSLYVFNSSGKLSEGFPVYSGYARTAPVIADIDGDGQKEIIIATHQGKIKIISSDGRLLLDHTFNEQITGNISVANMDADLDLEIIFGTMSRHLYVMNKDGSIINGFPVTFMSPIQYGVAVGDVTGDDVPEILFGLMNNEFHIISANADSLYNFPIILNARITSAPVVAHIKSATNEYHIFVTTANNELNRIDLSGEFKSLFNSINKITSQPSLTDLNNDGDPEILFGTDNGILYGFTANGDSVQNFPIHFKGSLNTSPVFADFDNDYLPEIIVSSNEGNTFVIRNDGMNYKNFPAYLPFVTDGSAAITDLDNDGDTEVIIGTSDGIEVIDAAGKKGGMVTWNTYMGSNTRTGFFVFKPVSTSIQRESTAPTTSNLLQNFPNPFNPETTIQYTLSGQGKVELAIYNVLGQLVKSLIQTSQGSGTYYVNWDGKDKTGQKVVSGVYFYKLTIESDDGHISAFIKKMLLVR